MNTQGLKKPSTSQRLFPLSTTEDRRLWRIAKEKSGLDITPQRLREWFCNELGSLGVQNRYIDAFCGRVPKSVLARHYSDYSPEKLKQIYDKTKLGILD